jgi:hypothetical protein
LKGRGCDVSDWLGYREVDEASLVVLVRVQGTEQAGRPASSSRCCRRRRRSRSRLLRWW